MTELTVYTGILLTVFVTFWFIKRIIACRNKTYPRGPYGFPILGHLPLFGKHPPKTFMKWWKSYGDVFSIRMGSWNTVVVNGYSAVKAAAEYPGDAFNGRPPFVTMEILKERNNEDSLAFGNFSSIYLKQRQLASKALRMFTHRKPEIIEELVVKEATTFTDILIEKYGKIPGYIKFDIQTLVVRVIYQFLYGRGKHVDIEQHVKVILNAIDELNKFTENGSIIDVIPLLRYIMPWKIKTFKNVVSLSDNITWYQVHEHYKEFSKANIRDVADAILASDAEDENNENRYVLTRSRLNLTLAELHGAGSDSTLKTIEWLLIYMCAYPDVQDKVYAELVRNVGNERAVTFSDKTNLVYTDAVILEVMRIVTQLPFSVPHYAIKDGEIQGIHIDRGTVVIFNLYSVHHEQEFWGDPEAFRPERFVLPNNTLDKVKCKHVMPFSIGRRRCVGEFLANMNVFLSFATIMQKCKMISPVGEKIDLSPNPGLVYSAKEFKVQVIARK